MLSEDLSFCWRLGERGIPLWIDSRVKTSHAKTIWVSELDWEAHLRER
jgi:hypothetical protein